MRQGGEGGDDTSNQRRTHRDYYLFAQLPNYT